ncbi:TetR/AcrR family transcriptional regulator [Estrella lausannensis]|uniref:Transcriptional regulator, TetR family n=1 Tax=Estrella lausannensis TaxID=483423 RepID=A0A0H5E2Y3_9BACT|nr:TetR/AcrR family transcriptional regulator [Estrella lausannensis]CRX37560.1 transcriptional regulator, TetR family [Estrella lausannensis]
MEIKKRAYDSSLRKASAEMTKERILKSAKDLFVRKGFEKVTIEEIAEAAMVSTPTIYAVYQSKRGVLLALIDDALSPEKYDEIFWHGSKEKSPVMRLEAMAKLCRELYDAEKERVALVHGAAGIDPVFKDLEYEREQRRYVRQEAVINEIAEIGALKNGLTVEMARDIMWAYTGRDLFRKFVVERGWSLDQYEKWLGAFLISELLD